MSDKMTPMPIAQLMDWVIKEEKRNGSVFGVYRPYKADQKNHRRIFGRNLETPIGPAAGPHTQLAQNIIAAYYGGSRFFELKTVQIMDGAELSACVNKPCIKADDECYNVEWSTELYVPEAMEEYIKAWFVLHVMAKEFELGSMDGFQFNMSLGYDLEGIQSEKIDTFLEDMKDAKDTQIFKECKKYLLEHVDMFERVSESDIEHISSEICNSATISTLHGCPPQEIEKIARYLICEKGLHTFIKCNPTLLGYEFARTTLNQMGYDYVTFGEFHFLDDLQYKDAIPMFARLMQLCEEEKLEFGVKITNTFPVDIKQKELPGEEMYMSGKSLYPLSIALAAKLAKEFHGKLRISYSGGADYHNVDGIVGAGIWPVTVATTLLKPGGYQRLYQMAQKVEASNCIYIGVSEQATKTLAEQALTDPFHLKAVKPLPSRKLKQQVPLIDCFIAPCKEGCPIHQDITTYMELTAKGKYQEALGVITEKNPLPFITGTICAHTCMGKCTRNFYEEPVQIRAAKLVAAQKGYEGFLKKIHKHEITCSEKAAVIGGGPAGLSAAYFLAKEGMDVTIFEKRDSLGGVVKHMIPDFRISEDAIEKDIELVKAMGVGVKLNTEIHAISEVRALGYQHIVLAMGAGRPGELSLTKGSTRNALEFLETFKLQQGKVDIGKNVVVIGGGNTAMDTARAAKHTEGVEHVYLVYRRTKRYMPAEEEELRMAVEDGVEFRELLSPEILEQGQLQCRVMELTKLDDSGRRGVKETGETTMVPADTVIVAVGEQVHTQFLQRNGLLVTAQGKALVNEETLESSEKNVYVIGDGLHGPATVVEGIRDGQKAAEKILKKAVVKETDLLGENLEEYYRKRGVLAQSMQNEEVDSRCLGCASVCETCAEVCPNRANVVIEVPELEKHQIIHIDSMCNECGNCKSFCPYDSAPYLDKFTLFANEADMEQSKNQGFVVLDRETVTCKVRYLGRIYQWTSKEKNKDLPESLGFLMKAICTSDQYLWV
ncbi:MAG: putative selenate reductase subunit YgfK [Lachnospiraceae bacterium]